MSRFIEWCLLFSFFDQTVDTFVVRLFLITLSAISSLLI